MTAATRVGVRGVERPRLALPGDQLGVVGGAVEPTGRARREDVLGQHPAEQRVHPADRVGHRHRRERVAVVAAADGEEPGAPAARPRGATAAPSSSRPRPTPTPSRRGTRAPARRGRGRPAGAPARSRARGSGRRTSRATSSRAGGGPRRRARARRTRGWRTTTTPSRRRPRAASRRGRAAAAGCRDADSTRYGSCGVSAEEYGCHTCSRSNASSAASGRRGVGVGGSSRPIVAVTSRECGVVARAATWRTRRVGVRRRRGLLLDLAGQPAHQRAQVGVERVVGEAAVDEGLERPSRPPRCPR